MIKEIREVFAKFASPVLYSVIRTTPIYMILTPEQKLVVDNCLEASRVQTIGQNRGTTLVKSTAHFNSSFNDNKEGM